MRKEYLWRDISTDSSLLICLVWRWVTALMWGIYYQLYVRFVYFKTHLGAVFAVVEWRNPGAMMKEMKKEAMKILNQTRNQTHQ